MPFAFRVNLDRALGQLRSLREQVLALVHPALQAAAVATVEESGYTAGTGDEQGNVTLEEVLSDVRDLGTGAEVDVVQLYDWVLGSGGTYGHCEDCPGRAAAGPYTAETLPGEPGDGSTRCGDACTCTVVPRELRLDEDVFGEAIAEAVNEGIQRS